MCGICGIFSLRGNPVRKEELKTMNDRLFHRGPDDEGYFIKGYVKSSVGLAMRRLSIIDLEGGHQPISNEDNSLWIVFNGEIYNFQELRRDLVRKGHRFRTRTDTEVILHLYEEYGEKCLGFLNGMFAFAIWDEKERRLFLARDRLGQKPLYYTRIKDRIYFSSEIKSFTVLDEFEKNINRKAIHYYLTYQYIPSPMTIYRDVYRLEPACFAIIGADGQIKEQRYWDLRYLKKTGLSFDEAKQRLYGLLEDSTRLRMIADVPLGAFLSGGHDSTIIVGLMSRNSSRPVKTFSIGFMEDEFSELPYARKAAESFGCDHNEFIVKPDNLDILPEIAYSYDQPYADSSALPTYHVARMTARHVKVALNGDGGDENFAGYLRHAALKGSQLISVPFRFFPKTFFLDMLERIPSIESTDGKHALRYARRFLSAMKSPPGERNILWHCFFDNVTKYGIYSDSMKQEFYGDDTYTYLRHLFESAPARGIIDRALYADVKAYLPEDLLVKVDVATMANSLETRSPFLDYRVIEFAASLPEKWKLHLLDKKYILKKAFKDLLPKDIYSRKKQGFGFPVGKWFRNQWQDYFSETVLSRKALSRGYFKREELERLFREHTGGYRDHGYRLWALLMLELWHRVFIDNDGI